MFHIQYIPRNMHTIFALLCFVVVIHWLIFSYPSGLLQWHCGNLTIAPVPAKQPWWIWINTSCEFIMNDCITTTKQSTTKPCAYFLGYTVHKSRHDNDFHSYQLDGRSSSSSMCLRSRNFIFGNFSPLLPLQAPFLATKYVSLHRLHFPSGRHSTQSFTLHSENTKSIATSQTTEEHDMLKMMDLIYCNWIHYNVYNVIPKKCQSHYRDVIMSAMVCSTVCSDTDQRKH